MSTPLAGLRRRVKVGVRVRWSRRGMRSSGLDALLARRPADAYRPSPVDMWTLYRNIRLRKPMLVMEFGTGCSTLVIAAALRRNGRGRLISVDANERWLAESEKGLPPDLRPLVTLHFSPCVVETIDGTRCHRFAHLPDLPLDFLFLDGPGIADVPDWADNKPMSSDPIHLEPRFNWGFRMLVDGRRDNAAFLRHHLRRSYQVHEERPFRLTRFDLA